MPDSMERLITALIDSGREVKRTGKVTAMAQCSGHQDGRASLSIRRGRGCVLTFCFAGCTPGMIASGVGLKVSDLFDEPSGISYEYRHNGAVARVVHRTPEKSFRQDIYDGSVIPLYVPEGQDLLQAVATGSEIWVPEGEKDCDTLASVGVVATTSPMGASNWSKADWSPLTGAARVVIVADNDEPGVMRARALYQHLVTVADEVRIVRARVGKDITDHIVAGFSRKDVVSVVADPDFEEAVRAKMRSQEISEEARTRRADAQWVKVAERFAPKSLREIHALPYVEPDWIIDGLMERGDRLVLTGAEGLGKSFFLQQMAICAGAGMHPFDMDTVIKPAKTFILDAENTEKQWRRRVDRLVSRAVEYGNADPFDNVNVQAGLRLNLASRNASDQVHRWLDEYKPDILVLGPIYKLMPGSLNNEDDMAGLLATLDSFRERGVTLLIEAHAGHAKDGNGERDFRPRGSSAMLGWPEFGFGLKALDRDKTHAEVMDWRGQREPRDWPRNLRRGSERELPWVPEEVDQDGGWL